MRHSYQGGSCEPAGAMLVSHDNRRRIGRKMHPYRAVFRGRALRTRMSAKILGGKYASARPGCCHYDDLGLLLHSVGARVGPDRRLSFRISVLSSRMVPSRLGIDDPRSLHSVLLWRILLSSGLRALSARRRFASGTSSTLFAARVVVVARCALCSCAVLGKAGLRMTRWCSAKLRFGPPTNQVREWSAPSSYPARS
jgi:hypothetical protein